jgi:hypothetical protein
LAPRLENALQQPVIPPHPLDTAGRIQRRWKFAANYFLLRLLMDAVRVLTFSFQSILPIQLVWKCSLRKWVICQTFLTASFTKVGSLKGLQPRTQTKISSEISGALMDF